MMNINPVNPPVGTRSSDPDEVWLRVRELARVEEWKALEDAYRFAERIHAGQWRNTAEGVAPIPYIVHPLHVALVMAGEWGQRDFYTLATSLLHDTLEDCRPDQQQEVAEEIERVAGEPVAEAVRVLTKAVLPEPCPQDARAARDARYFTVLRNADAWVRLVKCADRVDNLRDACAWGNQAFWQRYNSETIGWHLFLAHETAAIAEVALFKALVDGERVIRGRVPVWADGHLIDPVAAALIPEHIARNHGAIGLALRGDTLILGLAVPSDRQAIQTIQSNTQRLLEIVAVTPEAVKDALEAGMFGQVNA